MTDNTVKLPEPAFRLKWRDSYLVDKPNIGDTDCYTAAQLTAAVMAERERCARVCEAFAADLTYGKVTLAAKRCAELIRQPPAERSSNSLSREDDNVHEQD